MPITTVMRIRAEYGCIGVPTLNFFRACQSLIRWGLVTIWITMQAGADLPLVARRAEFAMLTGAIEAAGCGRGEAVLLSGEAGVGKPAC